MPSDDRQSARTDRTIPGIIVGAWREALAETGIKRVFLVILLALMIVPFAPLWGLLWALELLGVYRVEGGSQ